MQSALDMLMLKANSAFHPSGVGKWVPASAGKAKAGMVHSISGWTWGVQVKLWDPLRERMPYLSALEMSSRRGAIQIHVYFTLPYVDALYKFMFHHHHHHVRWHQGICRVSRGLTQHPPSDRDTDLSSQRLLRGGSISLTQGLGSKYFCLKYYNISQGQKSRLSIAKLRIFYQILYRKINYCVAC